MRIPLDIEDALVDLKGLSELVTASEWQRAALVWAFTVEKKGGRRTVSELGQLGVREFADLGISGMQSPQTVTKYRKAWKLAIDNGHAADIKPGDEATMPDVEWQPYFNPPRERKPAKPKPANTPATIQVLGKWDETAWDNDNINENPRLQRVADVMADTLEGLENRGVEGLMLKRIGDSVFDFVSDENKTRGLARLMHSIIEFTSEYTH